MLRNTANGIDERGLAYQVVFLLAIDAAEEIGSDPRLAANTEERVASLMVHKIRKA